MSSSVTAFPIMPLFCLFSLFSLLLCLFVVSNSVL